MKIDQNKAKDKEIYSDRNIRLPVEKADAFTEKRYLQMGAFIKGVAPKIIDVGCSKGEGGPVLKKLFPECHLTGLDCVAEHLAALPNEYDCRMEGLSTHIPVDDQSFDVVIAAEFLEHLYPHDVDVTLCEFQRILKVGGRLLLTTPNPSYLRNRFNGGSVFGRSHLTQHHAPILRQRLLAHGFFSVTTFGSGRVSSLISRHMPFLPLYGSYGMNVVKK